MASGCSGLRWRESVLGWLVVALLSSAAPGQELLPPVPGSDQTDQAPEVLDQGPVHEAFAEPVPLAVPQSIEVDQAPPAPIDEVPPDVKPEGDQVEWIPGYWQWSEDRQQFIWVSGVWRKIPPGRQWVPGYWSERAGKFIWVPGFWSDAKVGQINYLPAPPDSLDLGPTGPAPGDNYFWIPGCWLHRNQRYVWRPGFWHVGANNWVWVPSHYRYTPAGAVFVVGYWDFLPQYRGMLFAPVCWSSPVYLTAGYQYRPRLILDTGSMLDILYVNSGCGLYYFGVGGWQSGLYSPWYAANRHRNCYDPLYVYHSWNHPGRPNDWTARYQKVFDDRHRELGHRALDDRGREHREGGPRPGTVVANRPTLEPDAKRPRPDWIRDSAETRQVGNRAVRPFNDGQRQQVRQQAEHWRTVQNQRRNQENLAAMPESGPRHDSPLVESPRPRDVRPADRRVSMDPGSPLGPDVDQDDRRQQAEELLRRNQFRIDGRTPERSFGRSRPEPRGERRRTEAPTTDRSMANANSNNTTETPAAVNRPATGDVPPSTDSPARPDLPTNVVSPTNAASPTADTPATGQGLPGQGPATVENPLNRRGRSPSDVRRRDMAGDNSGGQERPSPDEFRRQLRELRDQNQQRLRGDSQDLGNFNRGRSRAMEVGPAETMGIPSGVGSADVLDRGNRPTAIDPPQAPDVPQREILRGQRSRGEVRRMMDLERSRPAEPSSRSIPSGPSLPSGFEGGGRGDSSNADVLRRQPEPFDRGNHGRGASDGSELRGLQRGNNSEHRRGSHSR
ncbi:MAG: hypothetical protein U0795_07995 [Pirellulales bacterium]